jgi:hypothetical protein
MAQKLKIWDKKTDLYPQVGGKLTPEQIFSQWGWTERPDTIVVITENGGTLGSIDNLEILKNNYGITEIDNELAMRAVEAIWNAPPVTPPNPADANEAVVSRLDYLIMTGGTI